MHYDPDQKIYLFETYSESFNSEDFVKAVKDKQLLSYNDLKKETFY